MRKIVGTLATQVAPLSLLIFGCFVVLHNVWLTDVIGYHFSGEPFYLWAVFGGLFAAFWIGRSQWIAPGVSALILSIFIGFFGGVFLCSKERVVGKMIRNIEAGDCRHLRAIELLQRHYQDRIIDKGVQERLSVRCNLLMEAPARRR
jgi:hypothetical protein